MLRRFAPCALRAAADQSLYSRRALSTDVDLSHEKPLPFQLEHVQQRLVATVPLMFKARLDYTFYRKDVFCDDQIFGVKRHLVGTMAIPCSQSMGMGMSLKLNEMKGMLIDEKSAKDKLAEKIAVFRPGPATTNFVPQRRPKDEPNGNW
ncbi:hypothetical protein TELCIR_03539 [Teladorsagia circumcincta]|uniref:Uncharacterized protein n=1 Tax=Teladorsagia circumcincta TaxID=45464 RepID=A0A2G9UWA6_TELCI|nr:hypothetical protein TELCIR_03539 [Teladorsagia circumcincta]